MAAALPNTTIFLLAWVFGGVNAFLGATAYAELGTMMPRSGGTYLYAHRAFGDGLGFFAGYADWINWSVSSSALIILVGGYVASVIPPLNGHALVAGCGVFGVLVVLQWIGVRSGGRAQEVTTVLKAVALVALIIAVFVWPHPPMAAPMMMRPVPHGTALIFAIGVAMQGVVFSYDSFYAPVYCAEELQNPGKSIPASIFRGIALVMTIYLLLLIAFLRIVPLQQMAGDDFVGATVAKILFGNSGDLIIRLIMIIAVLGTVNAQIMAAPRIVLAMARDGLFPPQATRVNDGGTPTIALALSLVCTGIFLFSGSFNAVLAVAVFLSLSLYLLTYASLFALRRKDPDVPRPYRAWGYPVVPALAIVSVVLLIILMALGDPKSAAIAFAVLVASWPLSHLARRLIRQAGAG